MFNRTTILLSAGILLASFAANAVFITAIAWPLKWLWNTTLPQMAHTPAIDYWTAVRLLALWSILRLAAKGAKISAKFRKSV